MKIVQLQVPSLKIVQLKEPFYHTIIHDFYTPEEEQGIWQEIEFLNQPGKLLDKNQNGDPRASENKLGLALDDAYGQYRHLSNILTVNRKIFNFCDQLLENPFANYLILCDHDFSFLSYYPDKSYYAPHFDRFTVSTITTFWRLPQKFTGGELQFTEYDYTPDMRHNSLILFPSYEFHNVTPLSIDKELEDKGLSRYTINQFMIIKD